MAALERAHGMHDRPAIVASSSWVKPAASRRVLSCAPNARQRQISWTCHLTAAVRASYGSCVELSVVSVWPPSTLAGMTVEGEAAGLVTGTPVSFICTTKHVLETAHEQLILPTIHNAGHR